MSGSEHHAAGSLLETAEEILRRRADSLAQEAEEDRVDDHLSILLFRLGEEWYSVKVEDVREIYQEYRVTPVPCVPDFIMGVVNIRGEIISVSDLARMMGLGAVVAGEDVPPAIVITNEDCVTAIAVDEIGDIADVPLENIEPPLSVIDRTQAEFIASSVHLEGTMVGLINVGRVLEPIGQAGKHDR